MQVARRRDAALPLGHLGVIRLTLRALWQFALLRSSLSAVEERDSSRESQLSHRLSQGAHQARVRALWAGWPGWGGRVRRTALHPYARLSPGPRSIPEAGRWNRPSR